MHYNLSNEVDVRSFNMKVDYLLLKGKRVNITEVKDTEHLYRMLLYTCFLL